MPQSLQTNRDLYLAIEQLQKQHEGCTRTLEVYLLAVLDLSSALSNQQQITLDEFHHVLSSSFTHGASSFKEEWREQYDQLPHEADDYAGWRATLVRQIVDLREMEECGTLNNETRYFGVYAPRKSYWYNFDPLGYLECAMAGSFGGWEPGDDTGRQYVPGPVAVFGKDGTIESVDPEDLPNPTFQMPTITWEHFKDFIFCGQIYE
ncbi:MAG: hypothetical protein AAF394_06600 [Planctomycetota bacterium]